MSATAAKNKPQNQPAPVHTTGRGAALYITLGMFMLTLGMALMIAMIGIQESYYLHQLYWMLLGLCGPLCPGLIFLLIWGGAKLLVSCRHRVSARNFFIVTALYLLALAGYTLIARVPQGGGISLPYLDFVSRQAEYAGFGAGDHYTACLNQAYLQRSTGAGGLIGMLIAYPLAQLLTRMGACLLVGALILALLLIFLRLHPGSMFRAASDWGEKQREKRIRRQEEQPVPNQENPPAEQAPLYSDADVQPEQTAPPDYYRTAPIYNTQPVYTAQSKQDDQGFFPVQPDLYEERFPTEEKRPAMETPDWRKTAEPVQMDKQPAEKKEEKPSLLSGILNRLKETGPVSKQEPVIETQPPLDTDKPVEKERSSERQRRSEKNAKPAIAPKPAPSGQALDEDDLPWEVPEGAVVKQIQPAAKAASNVPVPKPVPAPRHAAKDAEPAPAVSAPKDAPASWAAQVNQKKAALEMPDHTTAKGEPKQVFTDPVMPITGEKIAISPRQEKKDAPGKRLDGTTAPKVKQITMEDVFPYDAPPLRLLRDSKHVPQEDAAQEDERRAQIIEGTLRSFGVESEVKQIMHGPSITRFAIQIAPGVKVSKVANTSDNLALELKTQHVRVEAPIQGTNYIGIEVPNKLVSTVSLKEVLDSPEMKANPSPLLVALGKDIAGAPVLCDLSKMPHLLIAGATGSGKSVCINSIVCSLLYRTTPEQVRLIMVDPKQVELSVYNPIPHLLVPVVSDPKKAAGALSWVVQEMLERYGKFSTQGVRNLAGYNKANQGTEKVLPNIVVIIDEMADLMEVCRKDVEESIRRLAALARAAGIYMVLATQRPSVDVITGVIKNNIPSRIAFAVSSGTDSRTIIDINGAEKLMGKGDMLYKPTGASPTRVQGCFVSDEEVNAIAEYIGSRYQTDYDPNIVDHLENATEERGADEITSRDDDPGASGNGEGSFQDLLQQAIEMAVEDGQTSTSMLQRRLRVGYARAGRLIDEMEKRNIISMSEGSKPRKTLITREQYAEMLQNE
ncbi:MAG: DNA translocase FtsK [Clostridia bacterium]|nr:DNA translocase FtsK [Clostridia bacterium]